MEQNQNQQPQPPVFNPQQQQVPPQMPQYQPRVTARPMMGFIEAVKRCLKKYCDFKGRARRSEYWWFVLFIFLCSMAVSFLTSMCVGLLDVDTVLGVQVASITSMVVMLFFVIPHIAVLTRRLHDTGRSGWWVVVLALLLGAYIVSYGIVMLPLLGKMDFGNDPFALAKAMTDSMASSPIAATVMSFTSLPMGILAIVIFIFTLFDSKWGENKYGLSPKYQ